MGPWRRNRYLWWSCLGQVYGYNILQCLMPVEWEFIESAIGIPMNQPVEVILDTAQVTMASKLAFFCNHLKTTEPSPWWFVMITSTKCVPFTSMSYCDSAGQAGVDPGVVLNGIVLAVNEVACGPPKSKCMFLWTAKVNPSKIVMDKHLCGFFGLSFKAVSGVLMLKSQLNAINPN